MARQYAKRSENITRNQMILNMWRTTNKSLKQIADTFNVSYSTVLNCVHKYVEYNQGTYPILMFINEHTSDLQYTQAVVTRAWLALKRWYPKAAENEFNLMELTFGSDMDNNPYLTPAVEKLLQSTIEYLKSDLGGE